MTDADKTHQKPKEWYCFICSAEIGRISYSPSSGAYDRDVPFSCRRQNALYGNHSFGLGVFPSRDRYEQILPIGTNNHQLPLCSFRTDPLEFLFLAQLGRPAIFTDRV